MTQSQKARKRVLLILAAVLTFCISFLAISSILGMASDALDSAGFVAEFNEADQMQMHLEIAGMTIPVSMTMQNIDTGMYVPLRQIDNGVFETVYPAQPGSYQVRVEFTLLVVQGSSTLEFTLRRVPQRTD